MTCKRCAKWIPLAAGGDLEPAQQLELEQHLRGCLSCYREYHAHQRARSGLQPLRAPRYNDAPEGLYEDIMARVGQAEPAAARASWRGEWSLGWFDGARRALPTAATFLLFTVIGYYVLGDSSSPTRRSPSALPSVEVPVLGFPPPDYLHSVADPMGVGEEIFVPLSSIDPALLEGFTIPLRPRKAEEVPPARRSKDEGSDF